MFRYFFFFSEGRKKNIFFLYNARYYSMCAYFFPALPFPSVLLYILYKFILYRVAILHFRNRLSPRLFRFRYRVSTTRMGMPENNCQVQTT